MSDQQIKPLTTSEQKQHLCRCLSAYLDAVTEVEKAEKVYRRAKDDYESVKARQEELAQELGKYVGNRREMLSIRLRGCLYLIRCTPPRLEAVIALLNPIEAGEGEDGVL